MAITSCAQSWFERPPFIWFRSDERKQFLFMGLKESGKTTLLYRLKIPNWKTREIIKDMKHLKSRPEIDPAHHYEEMTSLSGQRYGIWDVPGHMEDFWPMFYKYLRITAVFFIVKATREFILNVKEVDEVRTKMTRLLYEAELRKAVFVLILNAPSEGPETQDNFKDYDSALRKMLGVSHLQSLEPHKDLFCCYTIDCAQISRDHPEWTKILEDVFTKDRRYGEGSIFEPRSGRD